MVKKKVTPSIWQTFSMYELPTQWHVTTINFVHPSDCIYGISYDPNQLTCGFYLTNFEKVWMEELEKLSLSRRAGDLGIDGLTDEKLILVLDTLVDCIPGKVQFKSGTGVVAHFDLDFSWRFNLLNQPPETSIKFLAKLNFQQFSNISYLRYEIDQLKCILEAKESFAKFLELNFKQTHGEQLIKQYKKNNKEVLHYITDFDQSHWENKIKEEYVKLRKENCENVAKFDLENAIATTWVSKPKKESTPVVTTVMPKPSRRAPIGKLISPTKRSQSKSPSPRESPKKKKIGQL